MNLLNRLLFLLAQKIELPPLQYKAARKNYDDVGASIERHEATREPRLFPQGSFRLGTVIRPLVRAGKHEDEYDVDLVCEFRKGWSGEISLKERMREILECVREQDERIESLTEKRHCWRLEYERLEQQYSFHLDVVPCVPVSEQARRSLRMHRKISSADAHHWANLAVAITDSKTGNYTISNPEGYARWFERRAGMEPKSLSPSDDLPSLQGKVPLQLAAMLLKRHRDREFRSRENAQPASILLTTLAAHVYQHGQDLGTFLLCAAEEMEGLVVETGWKVPNPVNLSENFADEWKETLNSEFRQWVRKLGEDMQDISQLLHRDTDALKKKVKDCLGILLSDQDIDEIYGRQRVAITPIPPWSAIS